MKYELDTPDQELIEQVRLACEYDTDGIPIKDVIDHREIVEALHLLIQIIDAEVKP